MIIKTSTTFMTKHQRTGRTLALMTHNIFQAIDVVVKRDFISINPKIVASPNHGNGESWNKHAYNFKMLMVFLWKRSFFLYVFKIHACRVYKKQIKTAILIFLLLCKTRTPTLCCYLLFVFYIFSSTFFLHKDMHYYIC